MANELPSHQASRKMTAGSQKAVRNFERKQVLISALTLVLFSAVAIVSNSFHMSAAAEQGSEFIKRLAQNGDYREISLTLQESSLRGYKAIEFNAIEQARRFRIPETLPISAGNPWFQNLVYDLKTVSQINPLTGNASYEIKFYFNRFRWLPHALLGWIIVVLFSIPQTRALKRRLINQFNRDLEIQKDLAKARMASQVAHDIRSPLSALKMLSQNLPEIEPEKLDLLKKVTSRIEDIASDLLKPTVFGGDLGTPIENTLRTILKEKKLQFAAKPGIQFVESYKLNDNLVAQVNKVEFSRAISNLINNSAEAIDEFGIVAVEALSADGNIEINIRDTGKGMPNRLLKRLGETGVTEGKSGTGLGISHAMATFENVGGSLQFQSKLGKGTRAQILIPR